MIDNKTPHLNLPLPNESNLLTEDVPRLREAFSALDTHAAQLETELAEALATALKAATDAAKTALWAGIADKPTTFTPATHGHTFAELGDAPAAFPPEAHGHDWDEVAGKPGSYPPETHAHSAKDLAEVLPIAKGGTGNTSGNAPTSTKWQTKRTITLTGAASGSVSLDGSGNVSLPVSLNGGNSPMMPTVSTFVRLYQWYPQGGLTYLTIPNGGTWAYFFIETRPRDLPGVVGHVFADTYNGNNMAILKTPLVGVVPGGTNLGNIQYGLGFAWRIA